MSVADNADWGRTVETAACDRWPLEHVAGDDSPEWFDARTVAPIETPLASSPIAEEGTPVEVKACRRRYRGRYGRWWIRRENHERLLEAGGEYVLAVYDHAEGDVCRMALTSATTVDALVTSWWECGDGGRCADQYRQVPWTAAFDDLHEPGGR